MLVSSRGVLALLLVAGSVGYRYLDKGRFLAVDADERHAGLRKRSRELIKQPDHLTVLDYILSVTFQVTNGLRESGNYSISMGGHAAARALMRRSSLWPSLCYVATIPTIGASDQTPANLGLFLTPPNPPNPLGLH